MICCNCQAPLTKPPFISKGEVKVLELTGKDQHGLPQHKRTGVFIWSVAIYSADNSCTLHRFNSAMKAARFAHKAWKRGAK